jgi:DNA-binding LytR/AlgR family response regulator
MKTIIIDDDPISLKSIELIIRKINNSLIEVVGMFETAETGAEFINKNEVDLVFLDVNLPGTNGFEIIKNLQKVPHIILISGSQAHAMAAFDYDVVDYLLKPFDLDRTSKAIDKVIKIHKASSFGTGEGGDFFIKINSKILKINLDELTHVEALADYVNLYFADGNRNTVHSTMKSMESRLPEHGFLRVHRSFIVNVKKIESFEDNYLKIGSTMVPVSRTYKPIVMSLMPS